MKALLKAKESLPDELRRKELKETIPVQKATPREDGGSVLSSCNMDFAGAAAYVVVARTVHEKMKVLWVVQAVVF